MEWMLEPTAWVGLLTLVLLEIVLGIDNLLFIAILVEKLPPAQRDRARIVGLSLALIMRLGLLALMSWLVTLNQPLIHLLGQSYSGRDLILIAGGLFLLFKGTIELHERIEQRTRSASSSRMYPGFWVIVLQIVILDAVFSIDAVITAVGMVDHLSIMMMAVTIAIGIMLLASKPLTVFVNRHPTVVILCLGFLLLIGFSLMAEGFGYHVPKGYLYAAIAFSVLVESANQLAKRNQRKAELRRPMRERTAQTVLRLLGKHTAKANDQLQLDPIKAEASLVFGDEERNMVSGVLNLSERNVHSIMTPRNDITWVNLLDPPEHQQQLILNEPHSYLPVCRGSLDELLGVGNAKEMIADLTMHQHIRLAQLRDPVIVPESVDVLALMGLLRESHGQLILVADEFGSIIGVVTAIDIFEAIAGEFPDEDETADIHATGSNEWLVDGAADLLHLEQVLNIEGLVVEHDEFGTLAGYLLERFGHLPKVGDRCRFNWDHVQIEFEVLALEGRRIATVAVRRHDSTEGLETV